MTKTKLTLLMMASLIMLSPKLSVAGEVDLPRTGQETCYDENGNVIDCTGTGQDGDIQMGVGWPEPRFEDNDDGTVTDHLTGLIWLKDAYCGKYGRWLDALTFCNNLANGSCGLTDGSIAGDWHMPNILELESLVNAEKSDTAMWLNSQGFTDVQSRFCWSATTYRGSTTNAWIVDMKDGCVSLAGGKLMFGCYVWPVRAGQPIPAEIWKTGQEKCWHHQYGNLLVDCTDTGQDGDIQAGVEWPVPRFEDNGDGTITDHLTGLVWLKNANCFGEKATWSQALTDCKNLASGSCGLSDGSVSGDWHLPNRKELLSLIDYSVFGPALPQDHLFDNVQSCCYWSGTTYAYSTDSAWNVSMATAYVFNNNKSYYNYVWPVRSGQGGPSPDLTISYPNGGQVLNKGQYYTITWNSTDVTGDIQIDLYKGGTAPEYMLLQLAAAAPDTGSYPFKPPYYFESGSDYLIGISAEGGTVWDFSNDYFTIQSEYTNLPDHFSFSTIPSPQIINSEFTVTIHARDEDGNVLTGYNGRVTLSSKSASPYPTSVLLENGVNQFAVSLDTPGDTRLTCKANGVEGYSNLFRVEGQSPCQGSFSGKVIDNRGDVVFEAEVSLYDQQGQQVGSSTLTDNDGKYTFTGLDCVTYEIRAEKNGVSNHDSISIDIVGNLTRKLGDIILMLNPGTWGTPVILIPGMMGSSSGIENWIFPKLSHAKPDLNLHIHDPDLCINDPGGCVGFGWLKTYLESSGFNVFDWPWDWRLEAEEAYKMDGPDPYKKSLLSKIDAALEYSTTGKVHIVAHSMGGLVARAYIQSSYYPSRNDIDKFAMVGTPNLGSSNPYYIWEGGDPELIDKILEDTLNPLDIYLDIYAGTIEKLWEETYDKKWWSFRKPETIRDFVQDVAPSLRQLMNTEEFLFSTFYGTTWGITTEGNENTWLKDLNSDTVIMEDRMSSDGSNGRVHVGIFVGYELDSTIEKIKCGSPRGLYEDGGLVWPPKNNVLWGEGDGTVPYNSAVWPAMQGWAQLRRVSPGSHSSLVRVFTGDIFDFLVEGSQSQSLGIAYQKSEISEDEPLLASLSLSLSGAMRACITDPQGRQSGVDHGTNTIVEDIPGSQIIFNADGGGIDIENPVEGLYAVTFFGERQRDFLLDIGYTDSELTNIIKLSGFCADQPRTFKLVVSFTDEPRITVTPAVQPVVGLIAGPYSHDDDTLTRITWESSTEAGITGYNLYSARDIDPYFIKIATVDFETTSLELGDLWCADTTIPFRTYVVAAFKGDGAEGFFSDPVQNNDRDHDGLIDVDEIICGTQMNNPDTDGDNLKDGDEYVYGTNPLLTDTDGDGYNDYAEITGGSDPLDENSVPLLPCEGDFEPDGDVDGSDLAVFAAEFGRTGCGVPTTCDGDFDNDGDVDGSDLATFAADFGRTDCPN